MNLSQEDMMILNDLVRISQDAKSQHPKLFSGMWNNSPFAWMQRLPNVPKHEAAKSLLVSWIQVELGLPVEIEDSTRSFLSMNGISISLKVSFLWEKGEYLFQQIRKESWDYLLCFGISPHAVHLWMVPSSEPAIYGKPQHTNGGVVANYQLRINPGAIPAWLGPYGGSPSDGLSILYHSLNGKVSP